MESVLVILAIVLAIGLGEIFNINTGLIAGAFAYIIGCFVLGMSVDDLLGAWPTDLFMVIFSISLFFNFAVVNGTLEKVANVLLYRFRKLEKFLPLVLYFVTALVSGLGAAFFTSVAVMGAIGMVLCRNSNMNRLYAAMAVSLGALSGANFMVSAHGVLFNSLLSQVDSVADQAGAITTNIFAVSFIYPIIVIGILCFIDMRNNRGKDSELHIEKPEPFTGKQKLNLALIFIMMLIVLGAPILSNVFSDVTWFVEACDRVDVTLVALVMAIVGYLCKLVDDPKPVFQRVPWDTIWLVGGVGMLVVGLASVIIGEAFLGQRGILCGLCAAVLGSIIYRLLIALAYQTNIFPSAAFRLISAVIVTIALAIPAIKQLLDMQRKRKENLRDAHVD